MINNQGRQMNYTLTLTEEEYKDYINHLTEAVNICDIKKPNKKEFGEDNKHPTIKPIKLMEWLIKLTTNEGDTVLDCIAGSFTTGQACVNTNRKFICAEFGLTEFEAMRKKLIKLLGGLKIKNVEDL